LKEREANLRAATKVNATASSDYQPKGVWEGRAAHVTAKATDSIEKRNDAGPLRGVRRRHVGKEQRGTGETLPGSLSGKDRAYKAGRLKSQGAGRESERSVVPGKACNTTRWREGALL
jgi:hypothetical protein